MNDYPARKKVCTPVLGLVWILCSVLSLSAQTKRIRPDAGHLIFQCRRLINPASGQILDNVWVEINNGRILRIRKKAIPLEEGARLEDFGDKILIPGLIDTHGHLFGGLTTRYTTCDLLQALYLASGVTTVRSPGSMEPEGDFGMMRRIDSGRFIGPRYFLSGAYVEGHPVTVRWMQPVRTEEEVRLKIDLALEKGATSVKIYAAMKGDLLRTAIAYGHARGVRVVGHIGAVSFEEAVRMGIDELFHGILALPDVLPEDVGQDFNKQYEALAYLDMTGPHLKKLVDLAAECRVVLTPTACVLEPQEMERNHLDEQKKYYAPEAWVVVEKRIKEPLFPNGEKLLDNVKKFIRLAHRAGCVLTTGTDQVGFSLLPGYSLWREMEIFAEAGLKPMEVLKAATANGAYAISRGDLIGSLEPGMLADMVVLDADPLRDIRNVRRVFRVIKGGIIYEPEKLLAGMEGKIH